jgi:hypothetical protein
MPSVEEMPLQQTTVHYPHCGSTTGFFELVSYCEGFEVLTAVIMKSTIFWDIKPCSPLSVNRKFGGTYHLHLQGRKSLPPAFMLVSCSAYFFAPEDGGDMFLRNAG